MLSCCSWKNEQYLASFPDLSAILFLHTAVVKRSKTGQWEGLGYEQSSSLAWRHKRSPVGGWLRMLYCTSLTDCWFVCSLIYNWHNKTLQCCFFPSWECCCLNKHQYICWCGWPFKDVAWYIEECMTIQTELGICTSDHLLILQMYGGGQMRLVLVLSMVSAVFYLATATNCTSQSKSQDRREACH